MSSQIQFFTMLAHWINLTCKDFSLFSLVCYSVKSVTDWLVDPVLKVPRHHSERMHRYICVPMRVHVSVCVCAFTGAWTSQSFPCAICSWGNISHAALLTYIQLLSHTNTYGCNVHTRTHTHCPLKHYSLFSMAGALKAGCREGTCLCVSETSALCKVSVYFADIPAFSLFFNERANSLGVNM